MEQTIEEFYAGLKTPQAVLSSFLRKVKVLGNGWATACCPFHDDETASFSVHLNFGNWKCHAASCGKTGGFFELPNNPGEPVATHAYAYTENNETKYLKVRYFPKTFKIFSVHGGALQSGKNGCPDLLYNWDYVKSKVGDIYVVEGEKDVDSLTAKGVLAVTGGSSSLWRNDFSELLKSRKTYLIPDSDDAGESWKERVCQTLKPEGIISFPDKSIKDISDWFDFGKEFKNLIINPVSSSAVKLDDEDIVEFSNYSKPDKIQDLIKGLIPTGYITLLYGDGGEGKSYLSLLIAHYISLGKEILGKSVSQSRVLYLDWELGLDEHLGRAYKISRGIGMEKPPQGVFYKNMSGPLIRELPKIKAHISELGIKLIIVDSCGPACSGSTNDSTEIISMFSSLLSLGITVLLIDHVAKIGDGGETFKPFGSVYKFNLSRSVIKIMKTEKTNSGFTFRLMQYKNNMGELNDPIHASLCFGEDSTYLVQK